MKIAVWHNLPSGGGKRALYDHVRGLLDRGHTVESWCPPTADQSYLPLGGLVDEHLVPLGWSPNGKPRFHLTRGYGATLDYLRAMDGHCRECAGEINRGGFDLLLANSSAFVAVAPIARYVRIPAVIYLQEPCRVLYEALPELPWVALGRPEGWWRSAAYLKRRTDDFLRTRGLRLQAREELLSARAFVSILVNSHYSRESILRAYGLDAKVCYLGIDTSLFVNREKPRDNLVVGVGMLGPHKNIEFVVRALAHVGQPRPPLVWVGNEAVPSYVKELNQLAVSQGVSFEPRVKIHDSEVVAILNRARMMVYAPRLEPFGFAPLEGNACGLPVVAVAEGGVRETVIHGVNGLLAEHDPQAMAAAIQRLLDDPACARQLGENGCKLVAERWTVKHSVDRLENRLIEASQVATEHKGNLHGE
jgi:glycosyltransferase involved in cell wall biosynthesis